MAPIGADNVEMPTCQFLLRFGDTVTLMPKKNRHFALPIVSSTQSYRLLPLQ